ncbi:MAG: LysR family transcriptional regulator, partial [Actinobacteria bacterium]|nr:LysR family transcriptional regulator [Actinomycetota bacterium]
NLSRAVFFGDVAAREKVESGSAFSVALATEPLPSGFVWSSVDPAPRVPLTIFWRQVADPVVANFVEVATEVAAAQGWLEGDSGPPGD